MTIYLLLFIVVVAADVLALILDLVLRLTGLWTITELVRRYPAWGIPLVALQIAGAVFLGLHFWG